jgi:carbamoyltransferase
MGKTCINRATWHLGHDSHLSFYIDGKYHNISIEKITRQRYGYLSDNRAVPYAGKRDSILNHIQSIIGDHRFDEILITPMTYYQFDLKSNTERGLLRSMLKRFLKPDGKTLITCRHHQAHAALGFYTSPFDKALVITTDGGGDNEFFTVSLADRATGITQLLSTQVNLGGLYITGCSMVSEITGNQYPTFAGKGMGLVARGKRILPGLGEFLRLVFKNNMFPRSNDVFNREERNSNRARLFPEVRRVCGDKVVEAMYRNLQLKNIDERKALLVKDQMSCDVMLTVQKTFEAIFDDIVDPFLSEYNDLPVVLSGGCALNVINNERIKTKIFPREVFVPSAPDDSGLGIGYLLNREPPSSQVHVHDSCPSVVDHNSLDYFKSTWGGEKVTNDDISKLLMEGKIIGYMQGPSELGQRALGFRSILCDPSYPDMKSILNSKVKFREWYRPFAPVCLKRHASKYFDSVSFEHMEFMSFACKVKESAKSKIPAIVHVDGSARLQTVTAASSPSLYKLLLSYNKLSGKHVLLNTSFNSWGAPIINTIEEALMVLYTTGLDYVVIDDIIFKPDPNRTEFNHIKSNIKHEYKNLLLK